MKNMFDVDKKEFWILMTGLVSVMYIARLARDAGYDYPMPNKNLYYGGIPPPRNTYQGPLY